MLYDRTLNEIANNINTGVEYEIALFYKLLKNKNEQQHVEGAINKRTNAKKVWSLISETDILTIEIALKKQGLELMDTSFETQNDNVGPADIVMYVENGQGEKRK
jgi:hypothetical protein